MKKSVKVIITIIYLACAVFALYYGWERNFLMTAVFLFALIVVGLVRFVLNATNYKKEVTEYIPMRSVKLESSSEMVNGEEKEVANKVTLVHVDEVAKDKVIIKLFKNPVPVTDCSSEVNK